MPGLYTCICRGYIYMWSGASSTPPPHVYNHTQCSESRLRESQAPQVPATVVNSPRSFQAQARATPRMPTPSTSMASAPPLSGEGVCPRCPDSSNSITHPSTAGLLTRHGRQLEAPIPGQALLFWDVAGYSGHFSPVTWWGSCTINLYPLRKHRRN